MTSLNCSSPNNSLPAFVCLHQCEQISLFSYTFATLIVALFTFFLPVYVFVLHLGFKQWRRRGYSTMAMSNFDFFTYHMVVFELLSILAYLCTCFDIMVQNMHLVIMGMVVSSVSLFGQLCLHLLTCLERHLAVVHPITYRNLKGERWVRGRNVTIIFVWLFSILMTINIFLLRDSSMFIMYLPAVFGLCLVLVSCLSVLRVLMRSGPGEGNSGRQHVDQSKLKAFYVIVSVLVVLLLRFSLNFITGSLTLHVSPTVKCGLFAFGLWISMPSSLLMPLLYLQRKGKLMCFKKKNY